MLFFCIFGTDTISFTYKYDINFLSKKKQQQQENKTKQTKKHLLPKNTLKDGNSGIIVKVDIHPRKYGNSADRKIKYDKKVYSVKYA